MTKEISSAELEQIITEEIEKTLVDEGFGDFVSRVAGAGKAAMSGALEKGKEKWKQIGQQQADEKQVSALMGLIGDYIQANRTDPQVMKAIKGTEIVKKLGLAEALPSSYEAELRAKDVTKQDVEQFLQAVSRIPSAQKFFKGYLPQAQQPQAAEPKAPQTQAQQAPRAQAASAVDQLGDLVAQGRAEQEPKSDRKTPGRDKFIKPDQQIGTNLYSGYLALGEKLGLNPTNHIRPMFDYLVSKGLLYQMKSFSLEEEQENPIRIWQDHGIRTEEELRRHPFFISLVNAINDATGVDRTRSIPFLVAIWKQGKLVMPKSKLDGPEYTKADIDKILQNPDYTDDQGNEIQGLEESKRWQKLAGILKD